MACFSGSAGTATKICTSNRRGAGKNASATKQKAADLTGERCAERKRERRGAGLDPTSYELLWAGEGCSAGYHLNMWARLC